VAIVSDEPSGLNNRMGAKGHWTGGVGQRVWRRLGESLITGKRHIPKADTVVTYKLRCEGGHGVNQFEAVLGKTHRTEF
jgi:hypothetical protein